MDGMDAVDAVNTLGDNSLPPGSRLVILPGMGRLILSLQMREVVPAERDDVHFLVPRLLRQEQVRAACLVCPDYLTALEGRGRADLLGLLGWHEAGIWHTPPPPDSTPPAVGAAWWHAMFEHHTHHLVEAIESCKRLLKQQPAALACAPSCYQPQIPLAASRLGIPILAHAPFDDSPAGTGLHYSGAMHLRQHLDLSPAFTGATRVTSFQGQLRKAVAAAEGSQVVVAGCDLTGLAADPERLARQEQRLQELARHLATHYLPQLSTWRILHAPPAKIMLALDDLQQVARQITQCLRPLPLREQWLSLADLFHLLVQAGAAQADPSSSLGFAPVALVGPLSPPPELGEALVNRHELWASCRRIAPDLAEGGCIPSIVRVHGHPVTPSALLFALADALRSPDSPHIRIPPGPLPQLHATRKEIRQTAEGLAASHPAPLGRLLRNTILDQCWTAKPTI